MKKPLLNPSRGVALVAVLAIIVLITALIVGLLLRAGTERTATANYLATTTTQQLVDSAVNLVQAQINDATTQPNTAWASQPGAIRIFNTSGGLDRIYRLYSATVFTATNASALQDDVPPAAWVDQPANWVDLNAPAAVPGLLGADGKELLSYPILDPRDPANPTQIATLDGGFDLTNPPGATTTQPAPMPVRWLYVLKDGAIVTPAGTGSVVTIPGATADNPIVGRIAFWADDETAKININTASDGTFWDVPHFDAADDKTLLARFQPAAGEFQRYPGHPATTSLRPVFESLGLSLGTYPSAAGVTSELFKLFPRYNDDRGSKQGTVVPAATPGPKNERLFPAVGEMLYDASRAPSALNRQQMETAKFFLTAQSRAPDVSLFGTPRVSIWPVDESLAANPSSPRTTPFDRLSAFASTLGSQNRFYIQRKNADSPTDDYDEILRNRNLYAYLQNYTSREIPGFGGNFGAKYPVDRNQILTQIFDYIRSTNLYDANLDPSGANGYQFTDKDGPGYGQVAPLRIGDTQGFGRFYTISEVGLLLICTADGNGPAANATGSAQDPRSVSNLAAPEFLKNAAGNEVDIDYNTGSPPPGAKFPANETLAASFGGPKTALVAGQKRLQAMLLFELTAPMHGYAALIPSFEVRINGLQSISLDGQNPFPASANGTIVGATRKIGGTIETGGPNGVRFAVALDNSNGRVNGWRFPADANRYPFVSNPFTVASNSVSVSTGAPFTIELLLRQSDGSPSVLVQTFHVAFPASSAPAPDLLHYGVFSTTFPNIASDWWGFDKRINWANESSGNTGQQTEGPGALIRSDAKLPIDPAGAIPAGDWRLGQSGGTKAFKAGGTLSDTVFTVMPKAGDVRLIAAQETVEATAGAPASQFVAHPGSANPKFSHSFVESSNSRAMTGSSTDGKLVAGASYNDRQTPDVPGDVSALSSTGDWDNGLPAIADGGYLNKADEGNIYRLSLGDTPYYQTLGQQKDLDATFFTPNRIMPSPVMFGSLPSGLKAGTPWRTLLFRPDADHPSTTSGPPDHLLLDLFTMPVVEPYAISEPFSTAGKVNMNYAIVPFDYITRSTGIRAVLESERVSRVPRSAANTYKNASLASSSITRARIPLNLSEEDGTLRQFRERFDAGDIFRSASEICGIYLVPEDESWASNAAADTAWYGVNYALAGDNVRERPYANIYPRLTTKSNSFTVYYTVQALKNPGANPAQWDENRGAVLGQFRGSTTIERYLDPSNSSLPDYGTDFSAESIDRYYRWRILANRQFAP